MSASTIELSLSQDSLFFPLPFTDDVIENVVQVKNLLQPTKGDPKDNVIAFKALSLVRHRYSVVPAVGFIAAGAAATISISIDPTSVRSKKDPAARELPTKDTKDSIFVDFAIVPIGSEKMKKCLENWDPQRNPKQQPNVKQVEADASTFWKLHGPSASKNTPAGSGTSASMTRKRLRCVFAEKTAIPSSLVMQTRQEGTATAPKTGTGSTSKAVRATAAPSATAGVAQTPRPSTGTVIVDHFDPPKTPRGSLVNRAPNPPDERPATDETDPDSTEPPEAPPKWYVAATTPTSSSIKSSREVPAAAGGDRARKGVVAAQQPDAENEAAVSANMTSSIVKQVLTFRIPYAVAGVLILLALLCGIFEHHTMMSWIIARQ